MRADLAQAHAALDWAEAQLPTFRDRVQAWLDENHEVVLLETDSPATHDVIAARRNGDLPLTFSIEAGAYVNTIRSALDMLAIAVGARESVLHPDRIHFPVAASAEQFVNGEHRGAHLMQHLSADSRQAFEALKPYRGGNDTLWAVHELDNTRKHRRLLEIYCRPAKSSIQGWEMTKRFAPVSTGFMESGPGETVLGLWLKGAERPKVAYTAQVCFNESAAEMAGVNLPIALRGMAMSARAAIRAFDDN